MKITVLGSGTSHGIPVVGCSCPVCGSGDPRDKRMRSSIFIEGPNGETALIDAGPEFRLQAIGAGINRLDAIFVTHPHADHIHGLDDVRPLSREKPIPIYGNEPTMTELMGRFSYVWGETQRGGGKPRITPVVVDLPGFTNPIRIGCLAFTPIPVKHGVLDILGWEIWEENPCDEPAKHFLYLTDTSAIPPASMSLINSLGGGNDRIVIIGGLRARPHETHFSFEEALNTACGLGAKAVYLTHICHDHFHEEIEEFCHNFMECRRIANPEAEKTECHPARDSLIIRQ